MSTAEKFHYHVSRVDFYSKYDKGREMCTERNTWKQIQRHLRKTLSFIFPKRMYRIPVPQKCTKYKEYQLASFLEIFMNKNKSTMSKLEKENINFLYFGNHMKKYIAKPFI